MGASPARRPCRSMRPRPLVAPNATQLAARYATPVVATGVHQRLHQPGLELVVARPVRHQLPEAARQHRAGEVPHRDPRQQQEAAVVDHPLEIPRPSRVVPADPAVPDRHAPRRAGELQAADYRPGRLRRKHQIAQVGAERDRVPEVVVASHQLPEQQALGGLAHPLDLQRLDIAHAADERGSRLSRRRPGNAGDRTDLARPRRLSGSTSAPPASSRSRNSRHSRAFSLPFGRRHRKSSHTVRASSIRLKPAQSRTISRISVTSRTLKARPENVVVATAIAGASPFPRHRSKTPRECPGGCPEGTDRAPRRRDQVGLAARKPAGGNAVPTQGAPKRDRPRAKTPTNRRKSALRRRATPIAES